MTQKEKIAIKKDIQKWASTLSDAQLEQEYYDTVFQCLGSEAERMYEAGWDLRDVQEQLDLEECTSVKANILEVLCIKRGIKLWESFNEN